MRTAFAAKIPTTTHGVWIPREPFSQQRGSFSLELLESHGNRRRNERGGLLSRLRNVTTNSLSCVRVLVYYIEN